MENNKTLRIRTNIKEDQYVSVNLEQEYDVLEILSMRINQKGVYKYSVGDYGVVVGRVLANGGFGVPNAKLSLFIAKNETDDIIKEILYPYETTLGTDEEGRRYNLLPDTQKDDCHRVVGSFPNKRVMLDEKSVLEVFDEYYRYTTRTNDAGDYMFYGVPTGSYTLHMDLDISDCGKLSQRPRDFIYKGYTVEHFENPNQFKTDTELSSLAQIFTQDTTIEVKPFWGDANDSRQVGITRHDIDVAFKFEPTCVFMGSIFTDGPSEGISQKCIPSKRMGEMSELTTGRGRIQIIRKTLANTIEELQIKGTQLIDGNGVWCFQIPMNLDYMMTDEYGNMVPTDSPEKGIPTRCEVRFRLSLEDENDTDVFHSSKVLVPHNPQNEDELDYAFGTRTKDVSFKSLMWNNVYTVKSFIPRFQKKRNVKSDNFTGIKKVNVNRGNNPIPYNNIRIELPFMFVLMCLVIKAMINFVKIFNVLKRSLMSLIGKFGFERPYSYVGGFCPELDNWYFAPGMEENVGKKAKHWRSKSICLTLKDIAAQIGVDEGTVDSIEFWEWKYTDENDEVKEGYYAVITDEEYKKLSENEQKYYEKGETTPDKFSNLDNKSIDAQNLISLPANISINLTTNKDYLMQCIETNLAQEYEVIKFDFYNDWLNGCVYLPQWKGILKYKKKKRNGEKVLVPKVKACMNDTSIFKKNRFYVQQCSLSYENNKISPSMPVGCHENKNGPTEKLKCHKMNGATFLSVFGRSGGLVHDGKTSLGDSVYYLKPYEFNNGMAVPFFATDIVMLGSLFECNEYGLPSTFDSLLSTTYQLPPNLAQTNLDGEGDTFVVDGISLEDIKKMNCTSTMMQRGTHFKTGVTKTNMTYDKLEELLVNTEDIPTGKFTIEYDDIYPVTEISGIDWGYNGAGYKDKNGGEIQTSNKLLSPGGHFLGISCSNSETNIRSCVNLKRACEIGTSLSERLEVPLGGSEKDYDSDYKFDVVNYLYIAPNGLIGKDQILDATFRSAFATMNQNSLRTVVNSYGYKEYDFEYLLPDSFDGCLSDITKTGWTKQLNITEDALMSSKEINKLMEDIGLKNEIEFETGHTIIRDSEVRSDDYIKFRMGDDPKYLVGDKMPVYRNSFYFYFGLKRGDTALDVFKAQYYAPCAPQVLSTPKGEMLLTVERPDSIEMLNKFQFNLKIKLKGMEKNAIKRYSLYRLYSDDYHIIESKTYGDTKRIEKFVFPKMEIEGQFTDNEYVVEGIPFGVYEVILSDEYGNELIDNITIGKGFITVGYDKETITDFVKSIPDALQNDGVFYDDKNPLKLGNGGYIKGDFNIEGVPNNVKYRAVVKRVTGYDAEEFRNFECVKNGDKTYEPNGVWAKWFDSKKTRLYLWGYGTYEVWVRSMDENGYVSEFKYDTFEIKDGLAISFSIGNKNLGLGTISYDLLYKLECKYGEWWNNSETFSDDNDLLTDKQKYSLYRTITDYTEFNDSKGLNLNVVYVGDDNGVEVLHGEGSMLSGDTWVVKRNELMTQTNSNILVTAADEGYVLNTTSIYNTMNENEEDKSRAYPLFYTNTDINFKRWGSIFCTGTLKNGIFVVEKEQEDNYNNILGVLGSSEVQRIFMLCNENNELFLVNCNSQGGNLTVTLNKKAGYPSTLNLKQGDYTLIHLAKLPVLRKPFKYVGIVTRGINSSNLSYEDAFVTSQTEAYKIKAVKEGSNRFIISVYDYNYISGDVYNNNRHNFTPDSGGNEFTTRYANGVISERDTVMGNKGIILQIPTSYLDNPNEKERLYGLLKNTTTDTFKSGDISNGHYLCQVFTSQSNGVGVIYYVLKLNVNKNETDFIE